MKTADRIRLTSVLNAAVCAALIACGGGDQAASTGAIATESPAPSEGSTPAPSPVGNLSTPIMFVTQVPILTDVGTRASTFSNHLGEIGRVPRGGDLMIRYPDGTVRNLTKEAGFGMEGQQGSAAIAVREPSVHWSGTKALFSMVVGAPDVRFQTGDYFWQIYEVSGLGQGETATITKVARQPEAYNNVSPIYGTDDRILFTSDRPRGGETHLYPQLDEYESMATVTGIWSLEPGSGDLRLLTHTVSGAFSPSIDSFGRVVFTRWDHLQRDQQAEDPQFGAFNFADEGATAARLVGATDVFPEPRLGSTSVYGPVAPYTNNLFTPWQVNQDGTEEETLNHIGRQELSFGLVARSFTSDPVLSDFTEDSLHANQKSIRFDGGLFHVREDPIRPGTYYAISAREFGTLSSDQIVKFNAGDRVNPELTSVVDFTAPENAQGVYAGGRFRNPLPLSDGRFVASHTPTVTANAGEMKEFLIRQLAPDATGRYYAAGPALTSGIVKSVTWWDPDVRQSFNGRLWELEPVEVVARVRPTRAGEPLAAPERSVFADEAVDETAFRSWLKANELALIVTRNQTTRDRADLAQPFNLQVPGGVKTVSPRGGKLYDIAHYQIFQADQVRGYKQPGRRPIAQALHDPRASNPANPNGPAGSVKIAADGSTAAFVPARRALTWQTTDANGNAVVRERVWVTFQPGEVRVCASCHGVNARDQSGAPAPTNKPAALAELLRYWKSLPR